MKRSDQEWIRLLRQGDSQAVAELWLMLFRFTEFKKYQRDEALRDMARDAAVVAFQRILSRGVPQFQFTSSFHNYCIVIFTREFNRIVVKKSGLHEEFDEDSFADTNVPPFASADVATIEKRLQPCLDLLPARERQVIDLRIQGVDHEVAAERLGLTRNYFHVLAHRAREKLWRCLGRSGFNSKSDLLSM